MIVHNLLLHDEIVSQVLNGDSDLLLKIFDERALHTGYTAWIALTRPFVTT